MSEATAETPSCMQSDLGTACKHSRLTTHLTSTETRTQDISLNRHDPRKADAMQAGTYRHCLHHQVNSLFEHWPQPQFRQQSPHVAYTNYTFFALLSRNTAPDVCRLVEGGSAENKTAAGASSDAQHSGWCNMQMSWFISIRCMLVRAPPELPHLLYRGAEHSGGFGQARNPHVSGCVGVGLTSRRFHDDISLYPVSRNMRTSLKLVCTI